MKNTNPFTDLRGWTLSKESLILIEEIKEIDRQIEFLDSINREPSH